MAIEIPDLNNEQLDRLDAWLRALLWDNTVPLPGQDLEDTVDVHRTKGRISVSGKPSFIQGVRQVFEIFEAPNSESTNPPPVGGKIVLIGRGLPGVDFQRSIDWFVTEGGRN